MVSSGSVLMLLGVCGFLWSVMFQAGFSSSGRFSWGNDHRNLLMGVSCGFICLGVLKLRSTSGPGNGWRPRRQGVRFQNVIVYSREGCGLCDEAVELLGHYSRYFNDLTVVDISDSEDLTEKYGMSIPVVQIDGKVRFQGRIDEVLWHRLIDGAPLLSDSDDPEAGSISTRNSTDDPL